MRVSTRGGLLSGDVGDGHLYGGTGKDVLVGGVGSDNKIFGEVGNDEKWRMAA